MEDPVLNPDTGPETQRLYRDFSHRLATDLGSKVLFMIVFIAGIRWDKTSVIGVQIVQSAGLTVGPLFTIGICTHNSPMLLLQATGFISSNFQGSQLLCISGTKTKTTLTRFSLFGLLLWLCSSSNSPKLTECGFTDKLITRPTPLT